jgi:hypothetical protein
MKDRKKGAVSLFIGALLVVISGVGLTVERNPGALIRQYRYDLALEQFGWFCSQIWLPAGIIGIPLLLWSLIRSLIRERKSKDS